MNAPEVKTPVMRPYLPATAQFAGGKDSPREFLERCLAALEAWELGVCLDFFEAYLVTLDASEVDRERSALRGQLFRRLLALNPPLAFRHRASREGI